jgi:hypothetical protein
LIRSGKTTLARLLAKHTDAVYKELSATSVGISDVRAVFEEAKGSLSLTRRCGSATLLSSRVLISCVDGPFYFWTKFIVLIKRSKSVDTEFRFILTIDECAGYFSAVS